MIKVLSTLVALTALVLSATAQSGTPYCFGDGTGSPCPCTNGGAGEGCANSSGAGALLTGTGNAYLLNDTFQLDVSGAPSSVPGLILRGDNQVALPIGDGILCASGNSQRSHVQVTTAGSTTFTHFNGSPFGSNANTGGAATNYQFWYRDPSNACSGSGFNFTNGWTATWSVNALAADITVLVIEEGGAALSGATVTLQGTDAASLAGLVGQTAANGTVTFPGVSGPYTVTAEFDFQHSGLTSRVATSLVGISPALSGVPASGLIGVPLFPDFEDPPTSIDATLSGRVLNMPTLTGNQSLSVVAQTRTGDYVWWGFPDPIAGTYSIPIPSGVLMDCTVIYREAGVWPTSAIKASMAVPGVGQTGPGTTLVQNFDFASSAVVQWNTPVSFTPVSVHPLNTNFGLQLELVNIANGAEFDFSFHDGAANPGTIFLPDLTDPAFAGYKVSLGADVEIPAGAEQERSQTLALTPTNVVFDFFLPPTILQPTNLVILSMQQFSGFNMQVQESGTGAFGSNGFNIFELSNGNGGSPPAGIDESTWQVFTSPGVTSFSLPPHGLPLFAPSQVVECEFTQWRALGYPLDLSAFCDGNVGAHLDALEALSTDWAESSSAVQIFLTP